VPEVSGSLPMAREFSLPPLRGITDLLLLLSIDVEDIAPEEIKIATINR